MQHVQRQNPIAATEKKSELSGTEFIAAVERLAKDFEEFTTKPPRENYGYLAYRLEDRLKKITVGPHRKEDQHLELLARKAADFVRSPLPSGGLDFEVLKCRERVLRTIFTICSRRDVAALSLLTEIKLSGEALFKEKDPGQAKLGYLILSVQRDNHGAGISATFKTLLGDAQSG